MAGEIDVYSGGGLAPYAPSQPLAPAPDWGGTDVDLLRGTTEKYSSGGQIVLGQPLPPGVSINQVTEGFRQLGKVFISDFLQLGHDITRSQKAVSWFMNALTNPPAQQQQRHRYNLYEHTNDHIFQAFANYAHDQGFPAKMVTDCCWWVTEASKRLSALQVGTQPAPRMATQTTDPTADLTDKQFDILLKHNLKVQDQTTVALQRKYGDYTYQQVIDIAQKHLESLPAREQAHFDQYTGAWPWTHMMNTVEAIEFLYNAAIGSASLPTNGPDIARELASIEHVMKTERRAYLNDPQLQARYRTLLNLKG